LYVLKWTIWLLWMTSLALTPLLSQSQSPFQLLLFLQLN
jgi:hypothetical protein